MLRSSGNSKEQLVDPFTTTRTDIFLLLEKIFVSHLDLFLQNLDVNLAVNNLLSRDEDEGEDDGDGSDSYLPGGKIDIRD